MATRRPGTVAAVNRQIDALLKAGRNPAKKAAPKRAASRVTLLAANPGRANKYAPTHRVESSTDKKTWVHYGDFLKKPKAVEVAKLLHENYPYLYVRVSPIRD